MLFGKTLAQKEAEYQAELFRLGCGVRRFAWWPVKTNTGQYVFLGRYWEYLKVDGGYGTQKMVLYAPRYESCREYTRSAEYDRSFVSRPILTYAKQNGLELEG